MSKTLLFVDDEKQILKAIRRLFLETDYKIYTADSGEEALQIMSDTKVDLIVADMRMPVMDGYELLKEVKQKYPATIRLILSGYAEEKLVISALQNNLAKIYLFKPWDNQSLIRTIQQALEVEEILSSERILNSIKFVKNNLLQKDLYNEIYIFYEQSKDMKKLIERITESETLGNNVLDTLNSSFWGVKFDSIDEALNRFGIFNIKNISIVESIFEFISKVNPGGKKELTLKHATLSNRIADLIYKRFLNKDLSEMNAVAGLMHDVGRYMLSDIQLESGIITIGIEASHQELGGYILNKFELTYPVIESALFHHSPMDSRVTNKEIVTVVHIASYYAGMLTGESQENCIDEDVFEYLGFSKKDCDNMIAEVKLDINHR
ncbi:MAG: response regulator [Clostridia bacterium]